MRNRYREVKDYKLDLPTGKKTFFLLQATNLTPDLEKLVRTSSMSYIGYIATYHTDTIQIVHAQPQTSAILEICYLSIYFEGRSMFLQMFLLLCLVR